MDSSTSTSTSGQQCAAVVEQRRSRIRARRTTPLATVIASETIWADGHGHSCHVEHGGGVCNSYGYQAYTQAIGVSVVRVGDGAYRVLAGYASIPANKVTLGGTAAATLGGAYRAIWDARYGDEAERLARLDLIADTMINGRRVSVAEAEAL